MYFCPPTIYILHNCSAHSKMYIRSLLPTNKLPLYFINKLTSTMMCKALHDLSCCHFSNLHSYALLSIQLKSVPKCAKYSYLRALVLAVHSCYSVSPLAFSMDSIGIISIGIISQMPSHTFLTSHSDVNPTFPFQSLPSLSRWSILLSSHAYQKWNLFC